MVRKSFIVCPLSLSRNYCTDIHSAKCTNQTKAGHDPVISHAGIAYSLWLPAFNK
jgi:hypothetical protein